MIAGAKIYTFFHKPEACRRLCVKHGPLHLDSVFLMLHSVVHYPSVFPCTVSLIIVLVAVLVWP